MRKGLRLTKRLVALFLVLLLSIESLAAVVSDNDGSAFITKAEFDSLKNNFQSQIDQYNTSIDSKIDGAITSYLSGINISKEVTHKVEIADWGKVLATNHVLAEDWTAPNINLTFNCSYCSTNYNGTWWETWWGTAAVIWQNPSAFHCVRNLVSAGAESNTYTMPDTVVWIGQSTNLQDYITAVKCGVCKSIWTITGAQQHWYSYLFGATTGGVDMSVIYALQMEKGYVKGKAVNTIWNAQMYWNCGIAGQCFPLYPREENDWVNRNINTSISLEYVDGKQYQNEHIINWGNYDWYALTDPTWQNTLGPNQRWTENDLLTNSSVTKKGYWGCTELNDQARSGQSPAEWAASNKAYSPSSPPTGSVAYQSTEKRSFGSYNSGSYGGTRTDKVMSVGVLDKTYKSEKIYQWDGKRKLIRDDKKEVEKVNLYNGALIAYAKMDEIFKWEPKITGYYKDGTTNTPITNWRVKLSKTPFGVEDSVSSVEDVLKNKGQSEDYLVTDTSGSCKFNVEIGSDTTIYCKWWPDDTTICSTKEWFGTLDLTQWGTYSITEE